MEITKEDLKAVIRSVIEEARDIDTSIIDVSKIQPEKKDYDRAEKILDTAKATRQAESIKDKVKLIRRLKAVLELQDPELAEPFYDQAEALGFTPEQMQTITELSVLSDAGKRAPKIENEKLSIKTDTSFRPVLPVGRVDTRTGDNDERQTGFSFNIYRDWDGSYAELWGTYGKGADSPFQNRRGNFEDLGKPRVTRIVATSYLDKKLVENQEQSSLPLEERKRDADGNVVRELIFGEGFRHDQTGAEMNGAFFIKVIPMEDVKTDPLTMGKKINAGTYK